MLLNNFWMQEPDPNTLSQEYLLRSVSSQTADAVTAMLSQAARALIEAEEKYRKVCEIIIVHIFRCFLESESTRPQAGNWFDERYTHSVGKYVWVLTGIKQFLCVCSKKFQNNEKHQDYLHYFILKILNSFCCVAKELSINYLMLCKKK